MATCPECRQSYTRRRVDQVFCSSKCNAQAERRALVRARALYRALYWWRYERKTGAAALLFICRSIREWIIEDQQSQRLPPPRPFQGQADKGFMRPPQQSTRLQALAASAKVAPSL